MDLTQDRLPAADAPKPARLVAPQDLSAQIESAFTYHAPKADQPQRYSQLREQAKLLSDAHELA